METELYLIKFRFNRKYWFDYCGNGTDFGGWSIVVIYEDEDNLPLNQISLFDGFELFLEEHQIYITLGPLRCSIRRTGKNWFFSLGRRCGLNNGENLIINGTLISDPPLNPANNQFNGTNSYTGSNRTLEYGLDVYDLDRTS